MSYQERTADTVRIVRWEPAPSTGGYYLNLVAANRDDFDNAVLSIKVLAKADRIWLPERSAWWIAREAVPALVNLLPALRRYLAGEQAKAPPPPGGSSAHSTGRPGSQGARPRGSARRAGVVPVEVACAFSELHLLASAPPELVAAARRTLARLHHPDTGPGGSTERMKTINKSADVCEAWIRAQHSDRAASA